MPSSNGKNYSQESKEESKSTKNGNSFGFSPSKYLSPAPTPTKNVSFSGIACEVNGVEESAAGKGPPLALYVG
jgi:hypothetical protein